MKIKAIGLSLCCFFSSAVIAETSQDVKYINNSALFMNDAVKAYCEGAECVVYEGPDYARNVVEDFLTRKGYLRSSSGYGVSCDTGGPIYNQTSYCVDSSVSLYYNSSSGLTAFICEAKSYGPSVNVGVSCDPDYLPGDMRNPVPAVGSGPGAAIIAGLMAPNRGMTVTFSGITAGLSVQGTYRAEAPGTQ